MFKVKLHPAFIIFAIILILQNRFTYLLSSILCIALHEWAHAKVAYNNGYYLDTINIMPYGAMISGKDRFNEKDGLKIACAGPLSNLAFCVLLLALWWLFPSSYSYTKTIFDASVTLATFNLLPVFPLDGARIILSVSKNPIKTLTIFKIIGTIFSCILGLLFLLSFFHSPNINLGIAGAILYISTINENEKEIYSYLCNHCSFIKRLDAPIKKKTLIIHQDLKVIRLIKHITAESETSFEIVDDNLNKIKTISESELKTIASSKNLHRPIKELLHP